MLPRVFIYGQYIGGAEDVQYLHEAGELGAAAAGRCSRPQHGTTVAGRCPRPKSIAYATSTSTSGTEEIIIICLCPTTTAS